MPPIVDDTPDRPDVQYPFFDHGNNLFVVASPDGNVVFRTSRLDEYVRTDLAVDLTEYV